ncbi:cupin domain-containing protein [Deinococcus alpinitundrae]|uniref:cupin domain-containing protein n=1 Tax=Deinococcus alpinitundrae TaxID=468913 RepID=UPI00137A6251|nr:cupin domain-containing protein [Deinococcus alpinitundrae]
MEKLSLTAVNNKSQFAALPAQIGTLFFAAGTVLPPNSHTQDEISFIHSGVLRTISGGQSELVRGGDVTFIPAGELHEAEVLEDVTLSYVLLERS